MQKTPRKSRKNIEKRHCDNADVQNVQMTEESEESFSLPIHSVIELEKKEEAVPSTSGQQSSMTLGTSSEESDSILGPKVNSVFYFSKIPGSKRKPNEKLEEVQETLYRMYSDLGGSQSVTIEMVEAQDNQNDKMTTEDALHRVVSDTSICSANSEMDKTPERLPDITAPLSPSGCSTMEKAFTEEQPVSSRDVDMPEETSDSLSKTEKNTLNNVISKPPIKVYPLGLCHEEDLSALEPYISAPHPDYPEEWTQEQVKEDEPLYPSGEHLHHALHEEQLPATTPPQSPERNRFAPDDFLALHREEDDNGTGELEKMSTSSHCTESLTKTRLVYLVSQCLIEIKDLQLKMRKLEDTFNTVCELVQEAVIEK